MLLVKQNTPCFPEPGCPVSGQILQSLFVCKDPPKVRFSASSNPPHSHIVNDGWKGMKALWYRDLLTSTTTTMFSRSKGSKVNLLLPHHLQLWLLLLQQWCHQGLHHVVGNLPSTLWSLLILLQASPATNSIVLSFSVSSFLFSFSVSAARVVASHHSFSWVC